MSSSESNDRATTDGVQIGRGLLEKPAPVSKNLSHLVGRTLVPFFTPDGDENSKHHMHNNDNRDFGVQSDNTTVRTFVDGYFVPQSTLGSHQNNAAAATSSFIPPSQQPQQQQQSVQQNKKPKQNKQKQQQVQQQPIPQQQFQQQQPSFDQSAASSGKGKKGKQQQQQQQPPKQTYAMAAQPPPQQQQQPPSGKKNKKGGNNNFNNGSASAPPAAPTRYAGAAFLASPSPLQVPLPKFLQTASPETPTSPSRHVKAGSAHSHPHADANASQSLLNLIRGVPSSPKLPLSRSTSQDKSVNHPPSPSSYASTLSGQPTLLPSHQPVPALPAGSYQDFSQPHAYPPAHHHSYPPPPAHPHAPQPYSHMPPPTHYPQQSYYATPGYPAAPTSTSSAPVALPSAIYSRYDRPSVQQQPAPISAYGHYSHPQYAAPPQPYGHY